MSEKPPTQQMFDTEEEETSSVDNSESTEQQEQSPEQSEDGIKAEVAEPGYNIVDLPSAGRLGYPSQVQFREVLVSDEETLSNVTEKTYSRVLNGVLSSIANDASFFNDMTIHDRDYYLVWVWAQTYSTTKTYEDECSSCGHKNTKTIDFTQQPVTELDQRFKGYYEKDLKCGHKIFVNLNTVEDELQCEAFMAGNDDYRFEYLMLVSSIKLQYPMPLKTKVEWVKNNITASEMSKIKQFHVKLRYGLPPTVEYTCDGCGEPNETRFPFDVADILRPDFESDDIESFL